MKRILHIGFGYPPHWSGGMVTYQIDLMQALQKAGYDVTFFAAGRYDLRYKPYLQQRKIGSIRCLEIVNSPNLYEPFSSHTDPQSHCHHELITDMTREVIDFSDPELIHIHDLRMHSASIVEVIRSLGIPVIKTIHNFWDFCPRGDLFYKDIEICTDINGGQKCVDCLQSSMVGRLPISTRIKGAINNDIIIKALGPVTGFKKNKRWIKGINSENKYKAQDYCYRRDYFLKMLNMCQIIHVSSNYCREQLRALGVDKTILKNIPLSVNSLTAIIPKPLYDGHSPIQFGYRGLIHARKGIEILLSAFSKLDQKKCSLIIYGNGDLEIIDKYEKRGLKIRYMGSYNYKQVAKSMSNIDVGIVPSLWQEPFGIVGLEYMMARIPVIANNVGGITEWLINSQNGLLYESGDEDALRTIMQLLIDKPGMIRDLQQNISPWKTFEDHIQEIRDLYNSINGLKLSGN